MSYTAALHIKFDSLIESVSGATMTVNNGTGLDTTPAVFGDGWQMDGAAYLTVSGGNVSTGLGLGFWLKSVNPGMVRTSPGATTTESLKMPVVSRANFSYAAQTMTVSSQQYIVYETTNDDGTNSMNVSLKGATTSVTTSNPYTTGKFHYFFINYDGLTCKIYIDLIDSTLSTSGTLPASLSASAANFGVNYAVGGSDYNQARNLGVIDDLVLFTSSQTLANIGRAAEYGALYIADSTYTTTEEINLSFVFDDSSTIQINSLYSNRGTVYVARSDGKIMKGVKTLWGSRHDFNSQAELDELSFVTKTGTQTLNLDGGALHVTNEIVKL